MNTGRPLSRQRLLSTTALQAAAMGVLAWPAAAQLAPNARPLGGQVVAGSAAISNTPSTTTIDQSSSRAAINWQSFNVGRTQSVEFHQPSSNAVVLNRVTGPDPSAIAGRIDANGQVIITNPSGVVFSRGSQVNAQSLVVSAAGITNANLMAGRAVFDQAPHANARIENAGTITVRQAGLAAMVAPSVANSGVINARLGRVVLAGAMTHTLDLYGDGLVSLDVGSQVRQVPAGPGGKPVTALVTNTGTIMADGGTVQLTAAAADGVIQNVVDSGGTVRANGVGARAGSVEIAGTGGSVVIEGAVSADGAAGGGTVAIGTTLARAAAPGAGTFPAGTSERTIIAPGARVSANALRRGHGGRVIVLSTEQTTIAGSVAARGGPVGGAGGTIELSGEHGFSLGGTADTAAPHGLLGSIVIDPTDLTIVPNSGTTTLAPVNGRDPNIGYADGGATATVREADIEALTGNIHLQAIDDLTVAAPLTLTSQALTLEAGNDLTVNAGVTISSQAAVTLIAASGAIPGHTVAGTLTIGGTVTTLGPVTLDAGTGGVVIGGAVDLPSETGLLTIASTGPLVEAGGGTIIASNLAGNAGSVSLLSAGNEIDGVANLTQSDGATVSTSFVSGGDFVLRDSVPVTIGGALTQAGVTVSGQLSVPAGYSVTLIDDAPTIVAAAPPQEEGAGQAVVSIAAPQGTVTFTPFTSGSPVLLTDGTSEGGGGLVLTTAELAGVSASVLGLGTPEASGQPFAGSIALSGSIDLTSLGFAKLSLQTTGNVSQTGTLAVATLTGAAGTLSLTDAGNLVGTLDGFSASSGTLALSTDGPLLVSGTVVGATGGTLAGDDVVLQAGGNLEVAAAVLDPSGGVALLASGDLTIDTGVVVSAAQAALGAAFSTAEIAAGAGSIDVLGTIAAGTIALSAGTGGIVLGGLVGGQEGGAAEEVDVETAGPLAETPNGAIAAADLAGEAGSAVLLSDANRIDAVGGVSDSELFSGFATTGTAAGDFSLVDSVALSVGRSDRPGGGLAVPYGQRISLFADTLTVLGFSYPESGSVEPALEAFGGTIVLSPFTTGRSIVVEGTTVSEDIATGTPDALTLAASDLQAMTADVLVLGASPAAGGPTTAGAVSFEGTVDLGADGFSTLSVDASGSVSQTGPLAVTNFAGTAGVLSLLDVDNFIGTLDGFSTTAGTLAFHTGGSLVVAGPVVSQGGTGEVVLSSAITGPGGAGLVLAGNVAGGSVDLDSTDGAVGTSSGIVQLSGSIVAGTLTGAGYAADLSDANAIGTLGDFTTAGSLVLRDTGTLTLDGNVTGGTVSLTAAAITQAGGTLTAVELDGGSSSGSVFLGASGNDVASIGSFALGGQELYLVTGAPTLGFGAGTVAGGQGSVLIFVANAVSLSPSASGTVIEAPGGEVNFDPLTAGRPIELIAGATADAGALALDQALLDAISTGLLVLGQSSGPITIGHAGDQISLRGHADALDLATTGTVAEGNGASLDVATLTGSTGAATLAGDNSIDTLSYTASSLVLFDNKALVVDALSLAGAGTITSEGTLTVAGGVSAGALVLDAAAGDLDLAGGTVLTTGRTGAPDLTLSASGAVVETGGTLSAGTLSGSASSFALDGGGNTVSALSGLVASGGLLLRDAASVLLEGSVSAGSATLDVAGTIGSGPNALISFGTLTGSASALSIVDGEDAGVGTLGDFSTTSGFSLTSGPFAATGLVVAGTVIDDVSIDLAQSGSIVVSGVVDAPDVTIAANNVRETTGPAPVIDNGNLTVAGGGTVTGTVVTLAAGNALTLDADGMVTARPGGGVTLQSGGAMVLAGTIAGPSVDLVAASDTIGSDFGTTVDAGSITQTGGGAILAETLNGSDSGTADLVGAGNSVGAIGDFTSAGGFVLNDTAPSLAIEGLLVDSGRIELDAVAVGIAGTVAAPSIVLGASGLVATTGTGVVLGETLSGHADGISLTGANSLDVLGTLASGAGLDIADGSALTVEGPVSVAPGAVLRIADDAFAIAPGGTLSAPGGTVVLTEFTPGRGLTLGGLAGNPPVNAATLVVGDAAGGAVTISGSYDLANIPVLELLSGGMIGEVGGAGFTVETLDAAGAAVVLDGANRIAVLGSISGAAGVSIVDGGTASGGSLTVAGPVTATGGTVAITNYGTLLLAGDVSGPVVALAADSTVTATGTSTVQNTDGVIDQAGGTISGGAVSLAAGDALVQEAGGALVATGDAGVLTVSSNGAMTLGGTLSGAAVVLTAASRTTMLGRGDDTGFALGTISQTGGAIVAGTLTGSADGPVTLGGTNAIGTLGGFSANGLSGTVGGFTLVDTGTLAVGGSLTDPVAVGLTAAGLAIGGTVTTPVLALDVSGAVTETGGAVAAGTLAGTAGTLALGGTVNTIGTLGALASDAGLAIADAGTLAVAGLVSAGAGQVLRIADDAPQFLAGGTLSAPGGTVVLTEFTPGNGIVLGGGGGLASNPPVNAATLVLGEAGGGPVTIAGTFDLEGVPVLDLLSGGTIAETGGGGLAVGTLEGHGGAIDLEGANRIAVVGDLASDTSLVLDSGGLDAPPLALVGIVTAQSTLAILDLGPLSVTGTIEAPAISLTAEGFETEAGLTASGVTQSGGLISGGTVTITADAQITQTGGMIATTGSSGAVDLVAGGTLMLGGTVAAATLQLTADGIGEGSAGTLAVGTLAGSSASAVALGSMANAIGTLGPFSSDGGFALADGETLTVAGPVGDAVAVGLTAAALQVAGTIAAGVLTLDVAGGVTEPADGAVQAGTLAGTAGSLTLDAGANAIGTLGALLSGGSLMIADAGTLAIAGVVGVGADSVLLLRDDAPLFLPGGTLSAPDGGTVVLTEYVAGDAIVLGGGGGIGSDPPVEAGTLVVGDATAGAVTIAGSFDLGAVPVLDLVSAGTIAETMGAGISVGTLGATGADIVLEGGNRIGTVGSIASGADALIANGQAGTAGTLAVAGPVVAAGTVALSEFGSVLIGGTVSGRVVALTAVGGTLDQTGGAIVAGTLDGSSGAGASLGGTLNQVGTLGAFAAGGSLLLADSGPLFIGGTVSATSLTLDVAGAVGETGGGALRVGTLAGTVGALTLDGGADAIGTLGALRSGGKVSIAEAGPLLVAGTVQAGAGDTLSIDDDALSFAAGGVLQAAGGTVALAEFTAGRGVVLGGGGGLDGDPPVIAATLVVGSAVGGPVTVAGRFDLAAVPVLDLLSAGTIAEVGGGALAVGTLSATGADLALGGANRIGALGTVAIRGSLVVVDSGGLAIAGPVGAAAATLDVTGPITEAAGGGLTTALLTGSASAVDLSGAANGVAAVGPFATTADFRLVDAESLDLVGAVVATGGTVSLAAANGTIAEAAGGRIVAAALDAGAALVSLDGSNDVASLGTVNAPDGFTLFDGGDLALTGPVSASVLDLAVSGNIAQGAGALNGGTLTGSAGGSASFGTGGTATVGTLGNFSAGSTLTLVDAGPLTMQGAVSAPYLAISAVGALTLSGGSIATSGLPPAAESGRTPASPGSFLDVVADAAGNARFVQTGTTTVTPDGSAPSTLRIGLPASGGTLSLADLVAPRTTIVLDPGRGSATGTIDAGGLLVLDEGGSADLSGSVASVGGAGAAGMAQITPSPDLVYLLNGCEIAGGCVPADSFLSFQPVTFSLLRPDIEAESLVESTVDARRRRDAAKTPLLTFEVLDLAVGREGDDATLQLPNISDRDY